MSLLSKIGIVVITLLIIIFIYFHLKDSPFHATKQTSSSNEEQSVKIGVAPKSEPLEKKQFKTDQTTPPEEVTKDHLLKKIRPMTVSVKQGDTLMAILTNAGVSKEQAAQSISHLRKVYDLRKLPVGQVIYIAISNKQLIKVSFTPSFDFEIVAELQENKSYQAEKKKIKLAIEDRIFSGVITNSLYQTAIELKLPPNMLIELIRIFSFDVDFQREIQKGDRFSLLFNIYRNEQNKVVHNSTIKWASMNLSGKKLEYAAYETKSGFKDYYDRNGKSVKKTLMRTPIDGARLSSRYGKRRHPILGYSKMHKGVDFAAPKGVPIMAAGDGIIEYIGRNGAYGKYIRIRHNSVYKTAYAHLSRFRKGLRKRHRVKQGSTIGYVGSTGRSTGPHLHYEVIKHGRQTNPMSVRLPAGDKLNGDELIKLKQSWVELDKRLNKTALTIVN
jgi:murein DD-endopeptidase MepM/ murein hydrolase activator NlpD